ncbi:hypothetical protein I546_6808 [Mycobacterium kansasii 732]|nr:hypothetical protein I546_6808 [Mycobacterium kansasii 732]
MPATRPAAAITVIFMNVRFCRLGIAVAGNNTSAALLPIPTFNELQRMPSDPAGWTAR